MSHPEPDPLLCKQYCNGAEEKSVDERPSDPRERIFRQRVIECQPGEPVQPDPIPRELVEEEGGEVKWGMTMQPKTDDSTTGGRRGGGGARRWERR